MNKSQLVLIAIVICLPVTLSAQTRLGEIVELPGFAFKYSAETTVDEATIWHLWSDVDNWKEFDILLEYSTLQEGVVFVEGAKGYLKAEGAPRVNFEIRELIDQSAFTVHLQIPFFQNIQQRRYFETNTNGNTVFTHEVKFGGGLSPFVYLFLGRIYKRETRAVVERIKLLAERG